MRSGHSLRPIRRSQSSRRSVGNRRTRCVCPALGTIALTRLFPDIARRRDRNRFAAAASARLVRVLKGEARLESGGLEIGLGAEKEHQILRRYEDFHPLVFDILM